LLRHTALFMWRDTTDDTQKLGAKKGLAYLSYGCPSVRAVDFGTDLFGGSSQLLSVKPWKRTPLWHARASGPPSNFDMALHLDFDDKAGLDAYNEDDVHHEVGVYNASVCRGERTARVDWWYDGPSRLEKGAVRHSSLYLWDDDITSSQKDDVRQAFLALEREVPEFRSVAVGENVGTLTTDYDLIVDAHFNDLSDAEIALDHAGYKEALGLVAAATKFEWTARITHTMASG
jgi:stress responsive alpha/beta barrel protein